jgi:AFG3 family protein
MIDLLGKRPFVGRSDDMDKWLDENRSPGRSAPPIEDTPTPAGMDEPIPAPIATSTQVEKVTSS